MKNSRKILAGLLAVSGLMAGSSAFAVQCAVSPPSGYNYMDATGVSACLLSGGGNGQAGNIGNGPNDPFLQSPQGAGYSILGEGSWSGNTWTIPSSFWATNSSGAIGFKFGTGNTLDEWFVYSLTPGSSTGTFTFTNGAAGTGGGLSHIVLYTGGTAVPEPATLALLGAGLIGVAAAARRRRAAK